MLASRADVMNADFMPTPVLVKSWGTAAAFVAAMVCLQAPAAAQGCGDERARSAVGAAALDGDTFRTADGQEWRLAGVLAPKRSDGARAAPRLPPGGDTAGTGDDTAGTAPGRGSPADAPRAALDRLVRRQALWLTPADDAADRYGRRLAVVRDAACGAVAERLLAAGHLRVYPAAATRSLAAALYTAEAQAMGARRGLWADSRYRVLSAAQVRGRFDSFAVVADRVLSVRAMRALTVVSFGPDAGRDFGMTIEPRVRKLLRAAGTDPASLVGRRVRVRGWLRNRLGAPAIDLAVPEQLEVIEP
jgi:endonuclease YncB( thermonuclease family)